ncbi:MAG: hydrogenase expression protein HupH [Alphaproteobacteria bacterium]|nr:hydrogenase expression protein HupH [Alphaproteobacteria bacterium]
MRRFLVLVLLPQEPSVIERRARQRHLVPDHWGIELHYRGVQAAPATNLCPADFALAEIALFEAGFTAQEEGFDAVLVDSMSDTAVDALRSVLDIPVVGPGRAAFLTALMLGERVSVLAMWSHWAVLYTRTLGAMGLLSRLASVRSIEEAPDTRHLLAGKEAEIFPKLLEAGRLAIEEDGADVICLGSTTLYQAHAYLAERLPVPVINPAPLSYLVADIMFALSLRPSRRAHPKPLLDQQAMVRAMMTAAARQEGTR